MKLDVPDLVKVGDVVRTSYGTGPYRVVKIHGPFPCVAYVDELELDDEELEAVKAAAPLDDAALGMPDAAVPYYDGERWARAFAGGLVTVRAVDASHLEAVVTLGGE